MKPTTRWRPFTGRTGLRRLAVAAVALGLLGACAKKIETQGHIIDFETIERIRPGIHDTQSVASLLGSPSYVGTFRENIWYFTTRRTGQVGVFDKETLDQNVVAVHFDDVGIVSKVTTVGKEDGRDIVFSERSTPTRGKELTFMEQLFGNIGRFSDTAN